MTRREAAIVSVVTGEIIGEWSDVWAYLEELMGRPLQLSDIATLRETVREKAEQDYLLLKIKEDSP